MTSDYLADAAFPHAAETDRVVRDIGIRSMVVAPLVSGETVFGALGAFSSKTRRLQPVGDRARPGAGRPRRRVDEQRAPDRGARRVAARARRAGRRRALPARDRRPAHGAARACPTVLQLGRRRGGPPAPRRRCADRPDRPDACGLLRWAYASGGDPARPTRSGPTTPTRRSTRASRARRSSSGRAFCVGRLPQRRRASRHGRGADQYVSGSGLRVRDGRAPHRRGWSRSAR